MKRVKVIARERIINPTTGRYHDDIGLMALNGYYENVVDVEDDYNKMSLVLHLEETHPELKGRSFEIIEIG